MSTSPERPLDGARLLILSAAPADIEPLTVALEDAGADLSIRFVEGPLPDPDDLDGVVLHDSFGVEHWELLQAFLARLPSDLPVLDAGENTLDQLIEQVSVETAPQEPHEVAFEETLEEDAEEAPAPDLAPAGSGRLLRSALTVIAVTALLWLVFGRFAQSGDDARPAVPPVGPDQQQTGTSELAGRVTRSDTRYKWKHRRRYRRRHRPLRPHRHHHRRAGSLALHRAARRDVRRHEHRRPLRRQASPGGRP